MRKYHQVLLLVLSAISILCFVFYKHEYDRLRKVMEVLDVFGSTVTEDTAHVSIDEKEHCLNRSVDISTDFWHSYAENFYVYSAFKVSNEKHWSMNSLAVVKKNSGSISLVNECLCALITGDASEDKFEGTIEWKEIENDTTSVAYSVTCNVPVMQGNSYLFSLYNGNTNLVNFPLHLNSEPKEKATSLCIVSSESFWQPTGLVNFILYYSLLGIDNFYLYHQGISDHVISSLNKLMSRNKNVTIHLLSWNHPFPSMDETLIQADCAWRHNAKSGLSITLQMGHYLVPSKEAKLDHFLTRVQQGSSSNTKARLMVQSICSNIPNVEASPFKLSRLVKNSQKEQISTEVRWTNPALHYDHTDSIVIGAEHAKLFVFEPCSVSHILKDDDNDSLVKQFSYLAKNIADV